MDRAFLLGMQISLSIDEIASITQPENRLGDSHAVIRKITSLEDAQPGDLSFLGNVKYRKQVADSQASLIFVPVDYEGEPREGQIFFYQKNPSLALARICKRIEENLWPRPEPGIHPTAVIGKNCQISETATIGPLCVIDDNVTIGDRCVLQAKAFIGRNVTIGDRSFIAANVTIQGYCRIGERVRLDSGVVIGSEGFGYDTDGKGQHEKLPQIGEVVIGDDVEIGANTTIDRARFDRTEIGEGTKIDNLVQLGHNVIIGKHCLIVAQVGIAGSTQIEDHVIIGGQVGVVGHVRIGSGSMIGAQSGISKDLPPKSYVAGSPALPIMLHHKLTALQRRLPELFRNFEKLDGLVKDLTTEA